MGSKKKKAAATTPETAMPETATIGEVGESEVMPPCMLMLHPSQIYADDSDNVRRPGLANGVEELVVSMLELGQQEPVAVVRNTDYSGQEYRLIFGFRRHRAATIINNEGLYDTARHPEGFLLRAELWDKSGGHNGLVRAVAENVVRKDLSDIERAGVIKRLKKAGMKQKEAAKVLNVSEATVTQLLKLLDLPAEVQDAIHEGRATREMCLIAAGIVDEGKRKEALALAAESIVPVEERRDAIMAVAREDAETPHLYDAVTGLPAEASSEKGEVGEVATREPRKRGKREKEEEEEGGRTVKARTIREVRQYWEGLAEVETKTDKEGNEVEGEPTQLNLLAQVVLAHIAGRTDKTTTRKLRELLG